MWDKTSIRGFVTIEIEHDDGQVDRIEQPNIVTNAGLTVLAQVISGSGTAPTHIAIGTGTTAAAGTDTALGTEVDRNALGSSTSSSGVATYKAFFSKAEANGSTIAEVGLFNASTGPTCICRSVLGATVAKDATKSLTITWTLTLTDN